MQNSNYTLKLLMDTLLTPINPTFINKTVKQHSGMCKELQSKQ